MSPANDNSPNIRNFGKQRLDEVVELSQSLRARANAFKMLLPSVAVQNMIRASHELLALRAVFLVGMATNESVIGLKRLEARADALEAAMRQIYHLPPHLGSVPGAILNIASRALEEKP